MYLIREPSHGNFACPNCKQNYDVEWDEEVYEKTYDVECEVCSHKFKVVVWIEEHYDVKEDK